MLRLGLDIGSTTVKLVAIDDGGIVCFTRYGRHNAQMSEVVQSFLAELLGEVGDTEVSLRVTGSVGMGLSERYSLPFVQEVVAATKAVQSLYRSANTMIDIGGEDAKIVFFKDGEAEDLRMNGNYAGGTGAFIDQMAIILGVTADELNDLALQATRTYPIASRCGVFCKTDIQNLVAKNVSRENIAASIFHAVAVQTVTTLAHGYDIKPPVLFCGGPLTFVPALRKAFKSYLSFNDSDIILPEYGELIPAYGTALASTNNERSESLNALITRLKGAPQTTDRAKTTLPPIFEDAESYRLWRERIARHHIPKAELAKNVISLNAQFGEGWLLPAEIISYAESGVKSVISLQPFGCIANHIVSKGVEKRIKRLYPAINLLSLDFDSGVSDVNIKNRLLLFIDKLKENYDGE